MKNITLIQRRFLIVWICINAFALFVNVAQIEGRIKEGVVLYTNNHEIYNTTTICLFMDKYKDINTEQTFYPFTTHFTSVHFKNEHYSSDINYYNIVIGNNVSDEYEEGFLGIFNGYSYPEFIIYTILGFAIVFLPKLWGKSEHIKGK